MTGVGYTDEGPVRDPPGLLPGRFLAGVALIAGAALVALGLLGPLLLGVIHYPTSASGLWQTEGLDLANLVLIAPILFLGAALELTHRVSSKFVLLLPAMALAYIGLGYGVGMEWGNPAYSGNSYQFAPLFILLITSGVLLTVGTLSRFREADAPTLDRRSLVAVNVIVVPFLLLFGYLWLSQVVTIMMTGTLPGDAYSASPTGFWLIHYLDLGVTIPLGLLTAYLLHTLARRAYAIALLFAGYFVTLGTSVVSMAGLMVYHHDPGIAGGNAIQLVLFPVLAVLSWSILYLLLHPRFSSISSFLERESEPRPVSAIAPTASATEKDRSVS